MLGAISNAARRALLGSNVVSKVGVRNSGNLGNIIAIPAREKVSLGEEIILGSFIVIVPLLIPIWVLVHIKDYTKRA